ncbi:hypothetical protein ADH76_06785 [Enterocloster clostridioformis]|nr:cyclic lactone autoinducer peptide [Bacteroides acidifaciens]ARE65180.1 hypothetical protein A4V08_37425 [Lachnoclostridium sp. YL32]NDO28593.1 cyclic lactone autoinducer peptide [Enterocloster clostridioformis]OXE71024.1 hypothetical protein ADH76_06785 [Enterocloster clostridioformis]QQR01176.1 cyclic lactone autoinducer peptide [Enterocloster clostridioformis]
MDKVKEKLFSGIAAMALKMASANVNSCCMYVMHQPRIPEKAEKLKKH